MDIRINDLIDLDGIYEPHWVDSLTDIRPPKKYSADCISFTGDFSNVPGLTDFVLHGLSYQEAVRMRKLLYIEELKKNLEFKRRERLYSAQELAAFEASITERIKEYNEIS